MITVYDVYANNEFHGRYTISTSARLIAKYLEAHGFKVEIREKQVEDAEADMPKPFEEA